MDGQRRHRRCLVGGTFDRLHSGHKLLLDAAQRAADAVEIHVTSDEMAAQKSDAIEPFESRCDALLNWIEKYAPGRVTVHELRDHNGPAPTHEHADCIVATPETKGQCEMINQHRVSNGLSPLEILEVQHLLDASGGIISSSRIRNGHIDHEGHPWYSPQWRGHTLHMQPDAEAELKSPMGTLYRGPESEPEVAMYAALDDIDLEHTIVVAVGDVTVSTMLDIDLIPDLAFIDGQTKRKMLEIDAQVDLSTFPRILHAVNPPGSLTPALVKVIEEALPLDVPTVIVVDGEEDLAPLLVHLFMPLQTVVLYGQPHQGVVVQYSHIDTKRRCRRLLELFEVE